MRTVKFKGVNIVNSTRNTVNSETARRKDSVGDTSYIVTALLSLFVGYLGVDRFYVGKVGTGLLKLFTLGGIGIWWVIDIILIYTGSFTDKAGMKLAGRQKHLRTSLIVLGIVIVLGVFLPKGGAAANTSSTNEATGASQADVQENETTEQVVPAVVEEVKPSEAPAIPAEYKSALGQAKTYSSMMHMSKQGLYEQLISEYGGKFTAEAAQYAMDNLTADWNANALAKAKTYQNDMNMSPAAIRDQLVSSYGEKFTETEADYAILHIND